MAPVTMDARWEEVRKVAATHPRFYGMSLDDLYATLSKEDLGKALSFDRYKCMCVCA